MHSYTIQEDEDDESPGINSKHQHHLLAAAVTSAFSHLSESKHAVRIYGSVTMC